MDADSSSWHILHYGHTYGYLTNSRIVLPQVIHYSLPESLEEYVQVNYSHLYLVNTDSLPQLI